jgi:hypothetical protein
MSTVEQAKNFINAIGKDERDDPENVIVNTATANMLKWMTA